MSGYLDWHVGMKVQLVDAPRAAWRGNLSAIKRGEIMPKKDEVYTVRALMMFGDDLWIYLAEIVNEPRDYTFSDGVLRKIECPFEARYFRPVQTRKTDISCFTAMLHGTDQKADA